MPIHKIEVSEYECVHCGYKWINRVNGKDGPIPERCAKCKKHYWNKGRYSDEYNPITPYERSLRKRLHKFEGNDPRGEVGFGSGGYYRPNYFCKTFLEMKPRPTIEELERAVYPLGWNPHKHKNFIRDPNDPTSGKLVYDWSHYMPVPDKPSYFKYNSKFRGKTEYEKILEKETQERRKVMTEIMKTRGVDCVYSEAKVKKELETRKKGTSKGLARLGVMASS